MTSQQCLELVRELCAVERLEASIKAQQLELVADEWRYGLVALNDRLRWLRYCLSLEDPTLVNFVVEFEAYERRTRKLTPEPPVPGLEVDVRPADRVH